MSGSSVLRQRWPPSLASGPVSSPTEQQHSHDHPIQTQHLRKDEDEHHGDEQPRLLCRGPNSSVAHDSNTETGRETGQADREPGSELSETRGQVRRLGRDAVGDEDGDDEAVDGDDAGHEGGHQTCLLERDGQSCGSLLSAIQGWISLSLSLYLVRPKMPSYAS